MSHTITDTLKATKHVRFLVEVDFGGLMLRIGTANATFTDRAFEGIILKAPTISSRYNPTSGNYSFSQVQISMSNHRRFQDNEARKQLDGAIGRVYLWAEGLNWDDIKTEGLLFTGRFIKQSHDSSIYSFSLVDLPYAQFKLVPNLTINTISWPYHRKYGGGGSVSGKTQQLIYGNHPTGVLLRCISVDSYTYLVMQGVSQTTNSDFMAGSETLYDKDGTAYSADSFNFIRAGYDRRRRAAAYIEFYADQSASEPIFCTARGLEDGLGEITGTSGSLIEHPADISRHLMVHHSYLPRNGIDFETLGTMKLLLPGVKMAMVINDQVNAVDVLDRVMTQCRYARGMRSGKLGAITFDPRVAQSTAIDKVYQVGANVVIHKTPDDMVVNSMLVQYSHNSATGTFEQEFTLDRYNYSQFNKSYQEYGSRPEKVLQLPDVHDETSAQTLARKHAQLDSHRHDIITMEVPWHIGWNVREGDVAALEVVEGASRDGQGWTNELCILMDRKMTDKSIQQRWWRIAV